MLEIIDLHKSYDGQPLLQGISFSVSAGETVCLLGASGSGKSTLLRTIAGLELPDRGEIRWDGEDLATVPAYRRNFGLVFQDYALFPHLNVFENVAFGLKMQGISLNELKQRVSHSLEMMDLSGFENRSITDLSGGEQQRVALARALAPRPRLLMFDEPLGALDRNLREQLMDELRGILHATGVPAIYVTHDQEEAFALADQVMLLHAGEIVRSGTPAQVWREPGSAWVARFLDIGNILDGTVRKDGLVDTALGPLMVECDHKHNPEDMVSLLVRPEGILGNAQTSSSRQENEICGTVKDVVFRQNQYKATLTNGLFFYLSQAVLVGDEIRFALAPSAIQCLS
jgi:spermidine/putrescine transport system ATP-binding protein